MTCALTIWLLGAAAVAAPVPKEADDAWKKTLVERTWKAAPLAFNTPDDALRPKAGIGDKGVVTLANRGMLVTREKRGKGTVSFAWAWTEGDDETGLYPDILVVGLRCSGTQKPQWSHEAADGVLVRFSPGGGGTVSIEDTATDAAPPAPVRMVFKKGTEYRIAVIDEGNRVRVVIEGKEILTAGVKDRVEGYTALYNREPVAGVPHRSVVQHLRLEGPALARR